ncbi:MAG: dephospho-CoA kinase [Candidatus Omnitrophica bacterium]|nr:dephospho-CoA kinase [Candidatus Omnitrophota bacterium]MDE2231302.1 dephospho-CoA kinase [Candidatus Omnitrophota bacterium]
MLVIGLTGNLGCGKSTVAAMFARRGAKTIDADLVTRRLLTKNEKCIKKVAKIFPGVILVSNKVDRSELAKIVFNHPRELHKLTNILYPEALKAVKNQLSRYKHESLVVLDAPLLFESGWNKITDITIVVKALRRQQIERACKRLGITHSEALRRLRNQMPLKAKSDMADMIIDNSHDLVQTQNQVDAIMHRLRKINN